MRGFVGAFAACVVVVGASAAAPAEPIAADDPLIGIWAGQVAFPTGLQGDLIIEDRGDAWRAQIVSAEVKFAVTAGQIRIAFPDNQGKFRGAVAGDGSSISGFWLRPAITDDPRYPEGATQSYAMPVTLERAGANAWRGVIKPLADPFTLYLKVFRDNDGSLTAAFRNPEQNSHGPAMQLHTTRQGDLVHFSAQPDPSKPTIDLNATLAHGPERLQIFWKDMNRTIELQRKRAEAANFFPRPPGSPPYVYRHPPADDDGWQTANASDVGFDEAKLASAVQKIIDIDPASQRAWLIHSLAVARHGKLVLDEYFYGYDRDRPHDLRSAAKTFSSVILGAAMMRGTKISPESKLYDVVAPLGPFANPDPRKSQITLAQVMTHTTGLACDDNDGSSPGNEDTMESQRAQPSWWKFILDLPMAHEPGARYAYCSGGISLTGAALTAATGIWLPDLFDRTVARPLQFGAYYWNLQPNDEGYLGGGTFVRPRDFLKLGQAYLDGGMWNGRRIVPQSWAKDSMAPHAHISPATTGLEGEKFQESYWETDEGYAWHMMDVSSGERRYRALFANGNGGQLLILVPEFDLAVVFTAGNYRQGVWNRFRDDIVGGEIIPALRR